MILAFYARAGETRIGFPFDKLNLDGTGSRAGPEQRLRHWDSENGEDLLQETSA